MATTIRPELSRRNKYWINKHRHYELKHFCLQYPTWKRELIDIYGPSTSLSSRDPRVRKSLTGDPTADKAINKISCEERVKLIERVAEQTDKALSIYILKAVTEGYSYSMLKSRLEIPCSRDMYYDRYRRFFWLLNKERD